MIETGIFPDFCLTVCYFQLYIFMPCDFHSFCSLFLSLSDERRAIDTMFFQSRKRLCLHALNAMSALLRGDGFDLASLSSTGVASPTSSSFASSSSSSTSFSASLSSTMGSQTISAASAAAMAALNGGGDPVAILSMQQQQQQLMAPASNSAQLQTQQQQQPPKSIHLQRSVYPWLCDIVCSADPVRLATTSDLLSQILFCFHFLAIRFDFSFI
jgi:hypothetical protein